MFKGKALYQPQGRSGEYAKWAINFYNGCTGGCEYCYNRRFPLLSNTKPTLKACFKDENEAMNTAVHEIQANKDAIIRDGGLFLSFVSDPCLPETICSTMNILKWCSPMFQTKSPMFRTNEEETLPIPVILLTKRADWILDEKTEGHRQFLSYRSYEDPFRDTPAGATPHVAFGFTLTGRDEMEPGCSSNIDRIRAMKVLHNKGYRTWASIEPIINFDSSLEMIRLAAPFCDHFKIGLRTDRKFVYEKEDFARFINGTRVVTRNSGSTVYFKHTVKKILMDNDYIYTGKNVVFEDYNIFKNSIR